MCPREKGFVLWGHCQNLLDDPRILRNLKIIATQNLKNILQNAENVPRGVQMNNFLIFQPTGL